MMNVGRADNLTGIQEPENYEAGAPEHLSRRNAGAGERSAEDEKKQDETEVRG